MGYKNNFYIQTKGEELYLRDTDASQIHSVHHWIFYQKTGKGKYLLDEVQRLEEKVQEVLEEQAPVTEKLLTRCHQLMGRHHWCSILLKLDVLTDISSLIQQVNVSGVEPMLQMLAQSKGPLYQPESALPFLEDIWVFSRTSPRHMANTHANIFIGICEYLHSKGVSVTKFAADIALYLSIFEGHNGSVFIIILLVYTGQFFDKIFRECDGEDKSTAAEFLAHIQAK